MLDIRKYTIFGGFETQFPLIGPILGNVIGSHYVIIVDLVSTDIVGIVIPRN